MGRRRWPVVVVMSTLLVIDATGAAADDEISPDRPDITNSTKTVGPGVVQIESGVQYSKSSVGGAPSERRLGVEIALRTGITDTLEAALGGEPFVRLRGESDDTGPGDLSVRLKYRFLDAREKAWWPSLGLEPSVKIPVAGAPIGSGRPDFSLLTLASFELPWQLDLDVNAGLGAVGQTRPSGYLLQALASASFAHAIAERVSAFTELAFASRGEREGRDGLLLNAGVVYLMTRDAALDAAAGTSLAGAGPDYTVTAGVSVRFGR